MGEMKIAVRKLMTLKLSKGNKIRLQQLVVGGSAGPRFGDLHIFYHYNPNGPIFTLKW